MMDIITVIGIIGMLLILAGFVLNIFNKLSKHSITYCALNIIGSGLLAYYALSLNSIPFLVLQIVWGLFALFKLVLILMGK